MTFLIVLYNRLNTMSAWNRPLWCCLRTWLPLLLLWGLTVPSAAGQDFGAGAFSRMGFGARGIAMGNALIADPSGNVSAYYNPALAPTSTGQRVAASAAILSFDRELQFLEFTTPLGPTAGLGFGLIHAGVGDIDGRDVNGVHTETLSTDEFNIFLAFGNRFAERLSVGAALKLYQADYGDFVDQPLSFALDLGAHVTVTERLHIGASVHDLLAKYEWDASTPNGRSVTDEFPVRVRLGLAYAMLDERLRLVGEYESRLTEREERFRVPVATTTGPRTRIETNALLLHNGRVRLGAAYQLIDILEVRAGVDRIGVGDAEGLRPSAGFGLEQTVGTLDLTLGYAVVLEPNTRDAMNLFTLAIFL